MSTCDKCATWLIKRERVYVGDGTRIQSMTATGDHGLCIPLNMPTSPTFGCNKFTPCADGWDHVEREEINGAQWQYFKMINCPDCDGRGSGKGEAAGICYRCQGLGKVRQYDDGYIGEERTRRHPKEPVTPPTPQQIVVPASPTQQVVVPPPPVLYDP